MAHSFQKHYTRGEKSRAHSNYLLQHVWKFKPWQPKQSLPLPVSQNWIPKRTQNTFLLMFLLFWARFDLASDADKGVFFSHFFVISHTPSSLVLFQLYYQSTHFFASLLLMIFFSLFVASADDGYWSTVINWIRLNKSCLNCSPVAALTHSDSAWLQLFDLLSKIICLLKILSSYLHYLYFCLSKRVFALLPPVCIKVYTKRTINN